VAGIALDARTFAAVSLRFGCSMVSSLYLNASNLPPKAANSINARTNASASAPLDAPICVG
jgi:hypothetical protein